ncbi:MULTISPECIES: hydroxymethylglutaryl-CoA reductase, degradative [unclassified Actinomyces]|uniref:hydroxymethylglutaryl-CoA reductase, degradative n=1 Tax=unclassified Actinomyces TaxID=2609248 RepID=UPI0020177CA1|nr:MULTISPECIES: hydroxymethylglutaryl-CoA reductase, degradative [unclassified Actinomyces]
MSRRFYELSPTERRGQMVAEGLLTPGAAKVLADPSGLDPHTASRLVENQVGQLHLPIGVVPGMLVNGRTYTVPLCTEEASVVAAASNGARIVREAGGFTAVTPTRLVTGQVVVAEPRDPELVTRIEQCREELFAAAARAHPSIVARGGGLREVRVRALPPADPDVTGAGAADGTPAGTRGFVSVDLSVDVRDAMGANIVDTIGEAVAAVLRERFPQEEVLLAIISNYAVEALVEVSCDLPAPLLVPARAARGLSAEELAALAGRTARRIALASDLAQVDTTRAVTHNKGVMNGIHAAALAIGNDTRAVEAGCHAWAARDGRYRGLSHWSLTGAQDAPVLHGRMSVPLPLASVGGTIHALPQAEAALALTGVDDAAELARVVAAVGLAQNLAALRALVTDGIQKGHMSMHSRALAITVGARGEQIERVAELLRAAPRMNQDTARALLARVRAEAGEVQ